VDLRVSVLPTTPQRPITWRNFVCVLVHLVLNVSVITGLNIERVCCSSDHRPCGNLFWDNFDNFRRGGFVDQA